MAASKQGKSSSKKNEPSISAERRASRTGFYGKIGSHDYGYGSKFYAEQEAKKK